MHVRLQAPRARCSSFSFPSLAIKNSHSLDNLSNEYILTLFSRIMTYGPGDAIGLTAWIAMVAMTIVVLMKVTGSVRPKWSSKALTSTTAELQIHNNPSPPERRRRHLWGLCMIIDGYKLI